MGELMCCELGAGDVVWNGAGDVLKNGYWEGCNWEFGEKSFCVDFGLDTSSPSEMNPHSDYLCPQKKKFCLIDLKKMENE